MKAPDEGKVVPPHPAADDVPAGGPLGFTVLETQGRLLATKRWTLDPVTGKTTCEHYSTARDFKLTEVGFLDLADFHVLLTRLNAQPKRFLVRGKVRDGVDRQKARRLLYPDTDDSGKTTEPTFDPCDRAWVMLDVDLTPIPARAPDPMTDPDGALDFIVKLLPEELHGVDFLWSWASSTGMKPKLSCHLFILLDKPYSDVELERWAKAINRAWTGGGKLVDEAVFRPVQPHYTAAPIFGKGLSDPLAGRRTGLRVGDRRHATLTIPPPPDPNAPFDARGTGLLPSSGGFPAALARIGGADGFHNPINGAIGCYVALHGPDLVDCAALAATLQRVIRDADPGGRDPEAIARYADPKSLAARIEWTLAHERAGRAAKAAAAEAAKLPPVDGAAALLRVRDFVRKFVVVSEAESRVIALWVAMTWAIDAFDLVPYLAVTSAEMRSGKTTLIEVLLLLVRNGWHVVQPSEAVLFRAIDERQPTVCLDEYDTYFNDHPSDRTEGVRAIFNAGFKRGATVPRCTDHGDQLRDFSVFCAKLLAGIGQLPPTIRDRCYGVVMRRKKRTDVVSRFRSRKAAAEAAPIAADLERWATANLAKLRAAEPPLPNELGDRAQDAAEPLLAIADLAGGDWPREARAACIVLTGEKRADDDSLSIQLLSDVKRVVDLSQKTSGAMTSEAIVRGLCDLADSRWLRLPPGRDPIDARKLAALLRPFGIQPRNIKFDGEVRRGYHVGALVDLFERYLADLKVDADDIFDEEGLPQPSIPPATSATPLQPATGAGSYPLPHPLPHPLPLDRPSPQATAHVAPVGGSGSGSGSSATSRAAQAAVRSGVAEVALPAEPHARPPFKAVM